MAGLLRAAGGRRARSASDGWAGADVARGDRLADRAPACCGCPGRRARAYLVQDHEPEFYATSAEREWAAWTYGQGLHCIARVAVAGRAAARALRRVGAPPSTSASTTSTTARTPPTAATTSCCSTRARSRRGAPSRSALLALAELHRRRPSVEIALFGEAASSRRRFPHRHLGVLEPDRARPRLRVGRGRDGAVDDQPVAHPARRCWPAGCRASTSPATAWSRPTARDGPVTLAAVRPARAVRRDRARCSTTSRCGPSARGAGTAWVAERTWDAAAGQVEDGLRAAVGLAASAGR